MNSNVTTNVLVGQNISLTNDTNDMVGTRGRFVDLTCLSDDSEVCICIFNIILITRMILMTLITLIVFYYNPRQ